MVLSEGIHDFSKDNFFVYTKIREGIQPEAPPRAEFLQKRLISAFFGFQWQNLAEILHLFKKYNNIGKVAVKRVSLTDYAL